MKQKWDPNDTQRLGQFFVNHCVPGNQMSFDVAKEVNQIFYCNNVGLCNVLIQEYLNKTNE